MNSQHSLMLRALSALLAYPDEELRAVLPQVRSVLVETPGLSAPQRAGLIELADELISGEQLEVEGRYVDLFDRGRTTSLNLFEHVHGDGRQRGDAMLELRERYHRIGLEQSDYELPDHLPVMLEYLSCCEPDETPELLRECSLILRKLGNTLLKRNSRYAAVLAALLELAGEKGLDPSEPVPPPEDLDESWEERPAFEIPADTQS